MIRTLSMRATSGSPDCSPLDREECEQVGHSVFGDSQVRNDVVEGAAVRRVLREGSPDRRGKLSDG
jgi:hypothetical protein